MSRLIEQITKPDYQSLQFDDWFSRNSKTTFCYKALQRENLGLLTLVKARISLTLVGLEQRLQDTSIKTSDPVSKIGEAINVFIPSLLKRLEVVLTRTLVLELNIAKLRGELSGEDSKSRFSSFVKKLETPCFQESLFNEYPVLFSLIDEQLHQWASYCSETLTRLRQDFGLLNKKFSIGKNGLGKLKRIYADEGDCHSDGRTVAIVEFTSGAKVVYKPRSLSSDVNFQELLSFFNTHTGSECFKAITIIERGDYGWCEFVEAKSLNNLNDVEEYYYHFGCLLALLYLIGATDIHYENLIARKNYPIAIDLETLFSPQTVSADIYTSLSTDMLPKRVWQTADNNGADVGAISAKSGNGIATKVKAYVNKNTDEMHYENLSAYLSAANNIPCLQGKNVSYGSYIDTVVAGYSHIYKFVSENKELILDSVYLKRMWLQPYRHILRGTHFYHQLLSASYHPDLLRQYNKRAEFLFERLCNDSDNKHGVEIVKAELHCLETSNIPIFTHRVTTKHLYQNKRGIKTDYFDTSAQQEFITRFQSISHEHFKTSCSLIKQSLIQHKEGRGYDDLVERFPEWPFKDSQLVNNDSLLIAADRIGEHLLKHAIHSTDDASWLGTKKSHDNDTLEEIGRDFHSGRLGPILFLAYLGKLVRKDEYSQLARKSFLGLARKISKGIGYDNIGLTGWGGYVYVLAGLYSIWNKQKLAPYIRCALERIANAIHDDDCFDIMNGASGCILALLTLATHDEYEEQATQIAQYCGLHLLEHCQSNADSFGWPFHECDRILTGFSHGNSGPALALDNLFAKTGDNRFLSAASAAVAYENELYCSNESNWPDLRENEDSKCMTAWCHGAAGIALSRVLSKSSIAPQSAQRDIQLACNAIMNQKVDGNSTLCHGTVGNLDILHSLSLSMDDETLTANYKLVLTDVISHFSKQRYFAKPTQAYQQPGFMTGLSGIGYALLRCHAPYQVPNALALSPPFRQ